MTRASKASTSGRSKRAAATSAAITSAADAAKAAEAAERNDWRAIDELQEAIARQPDNSDSWSRLSALLARAGRPEEALAAIRRTIDLRLAYATETTAGDWGAAPDVDPAAPDAATLQRLRDAVKLQPADADNWLRWSSALWACRQLYEAIRALETAVKKAPRDGRLYRQFSRYALDYGEYETAVAAARTLVDVEPTAADNWLLRAEAAAEEELWEEARWSAETALTLAPMSAQAQYWLGLSSWELGLPGKAAEALQRASHDASLAPRARLYLAACLYDLAGEQASFAHVGADPDHPPDAVQAATILGRFLLDHNRPLQANPVLAAAHERSPSEPLVAATYCESLICVGRLRESRAILSSLILEDPGNLWIANMMAVACGQAGSGPRGKH